MDIENTKETVKKEVQKSVIAVKVIAPFVLLGRKYRAGDEIRLPEETATNLKKQRFVLFIS